MIILWEHEWKIGLLNNKQPEWDAENTEHHNTSHNSLTNYEILFLWFTYHIKYGCLLSFGATVATTTTTRNEMQLSIMFIVMYIECGCVFKIIFLHLSFTLSFGYLATLSHVLCASVASFILIRSLFCSALFLVVVIGENE